MEALIANFRIAFFEEFKKQRKIALDCQLDIGIAVVFNAQHLVNNDFLAHKQGVDTQQ